MNLPAISPVGSGSNAVYAASPYLNVTPRLPDTPAPGAPPAVPDGTLGGDGGTLVQEYGAVALVSGFQPLTAISTAHAQPLVPSVEPVLPAGYRHIDTYA